VTLDTLLTVARLRGPTGSNRQARTDSPVASVRCDTDSASTTSFDTTVTLAHQPPINEPWGTRLPAFQTMLISWTSARFAHMGGTNQLRC